MSIIREVYRGLDERKGEYSVSPTVHDITNAVCDRYELLSAIEKAEHVMFACQPQIDAAQADLDRAKAAQRICRDRVMELRKQLMQMEAQQ